MTRREEIEKASICQYQVIGTIEEQKAFKNGFVKGAYWADTTMIEKACEWIKQQQDLLEDSFSDAGDFADLLKEAMEGTDL